MGWLALWLVVLLGDVNELPLMSDTTVITSAPTKTPSLPTTGITVTAPHTTNMRLAPNSDAPVVAELPYGVKGNAIGRNAGSNWILVEYDGDEGWVARWSVWVSDNFAGLSVEDDSDEPVPTIEDTITVQAVFDLTVRANPGGNQYAPIGLIAAGQTVEPLARTEDSQWLKVNVDGAVGWIAGWPVLPNADLLLLPVEEPII